MNWNDLVCYNPETGDLVWKTRTEEMFVHARYAQHWNKLWAGKLAGRKFFKHRTGRPHQINIIAKIGSDKIATGAHRVIWEMHYGPIPHGMVIDHINGNPFDNRLRNLRLATLAQNARNARKNSNNTSGFKGVSFHKVTQKWSASIRIGRRSRHLGLFDSPEEAHGAYMLASSAEYGDFANHGSIETAASHDYDRVVIPLEEAIRMRL